MDRAQLERVIDGDTVDANCPTKDDKRDRILICWTDGHPEYLESTKLEVVNEIR